ncbi:6-bladed beta-propeller [Acanthopleuribacter pedis]|uniref:6-bladed beta-propeller n=1 Tax=Acanthopleuribacter pedis TaxID=442870 RepID=A0A8J7QGP0_9BACT|nr:6-bladed beta-propeller [Acanthopleuribacter pedis]MBO1321975.1 6-bladed beta-propeller [Acanthopleuribacter pedis]
MVGMWLNGRALRLLVMGVLLLSGVGGWVSALSAAEPSGSSGKKLVFTERTQFGLPSEATDDLFLESPSDLMMDKQGRLYVLDRGAKTVFVWDADGRYRTNLGREGQGPGEFTFKSSRCMLSYDGETLFVVDSDAGKIHHFVDLEYQQTRKKPTRFHMLLYLRHLKNGNIFLINQNYRNKVPYSQLLLTDGDFKIIKELDHFEDKTFSRNENGGWDFHAYAPRPLVYAAYGLDYFLLSDNRGETVDVYDLDGNLKRKINVALSRPLLTQADKDALREQVRWAKPPHRVFFPDYGERFTSFLPLAGEQLFIYSKDFGNGTLTGKILDWQGRNLGPGTLVLGVEGRVDVFPAGVVTILADEEGNYAVKAHQATLR